MRVDVNDEAGRLRRQEMPLQCAVGDDCGGCALLDNKVNTNVNRCDASECDNCGDSMVACRCNPGES